MDNLTSLIISNEYENSKDQSEIKIELQSCDSSEIEDFVIPAISNNFTYQQLNRISEKIDQLSCNADTLDYIVSASSGILTATVDAVLKEIRLNKILGNTDGKDLLDFFNESGGQEINKKISKLAQNEKVQNTAKKAIEKGTSEVASAENKANKLSGMVSYFEKRFNIPSDSLEHSFGGSTKHHLYDFAHHPSIVGLFFSLLTQFTKKCYGTNKSGTFQVVNLEFSDKESSRIAKVVNKEVKEIRVIGKDTKEKIFFGTVVWYYHLISDLAGSSSTLRAVEKHNISTVGVGAGIPGPLMSLAKALSALPIFSKTKVDDKGRETVENKFAQWIDSLFDGSKFSLTNENGNIVKRKIDYRTELGIRKELVMEAIPVEINAMFVRTFYFVRRTYTEIKENKIKNIKDLDKIDKKRIFPFMNGTVTRMLTVATGCFVATNAAIDAAISLAKSGGNPAIFAKQFVMRINFVGVGRFAIAIGSEITIAIQKSRLINNTELIEAIQNDQIEKVDSQRDNIVNELVGAINGTTEEGINRLLNNL